MVTPADTQIPTAAVLTATHTLPPPATASASPSDTPVPIVLGTASPTSTPISTETGTATLIPSPTETETPAPTSIPTYVKLRGEVAIEQAVCHYGPGKPYLYKYGVVKGSNLEIIRRLEGGADLFIEVQAIGGNNPCWLNAEYMKVKGDLMNVQPVRAEDVRLPISPYYRSLAGVTATRKGNEVTIAWPPLVLKAGDESEQYPYLVEAWVCRAGQIVFIPTGSWQTSVTIIDEPGCAEPSHGRAYGVEKHGYTHWLEIPWPKP